jgi:hypothetical protein
MNPQPTPLPPDEREMIKRWIEAWKAAGPELEKMRAEDIRSADTALAIEQLADAFASALYLHRPRPDSGLVEQQRWFSRLRRETSV